MHHRGMRVKHHFPARFLHPLAVVHLLVIKEIARVEQTHLVEYFAAYQVEAAGQPVTLAHRGVVPVHFVDHLQPWEEPPQPGTPNEHIERRGEVATAWLQVAIATLQAHPQYAALRVGVHVVERFLQRVGGNEGIGIEQQGVLALGAHLGHALHRVIARGIVDHQVAGQPLAVGPAQCIEHRLQQSSGIEVHHHDIHRFASHFCRPRRNTDVFAPSIAVQLPGHRPRCAASPGLSMGRLRNVPRPVGSTARWYR